MITMIRFPNMIEFIIKKDFDIESFNYILISLFECYFLDKSIVKHHIYTANILVKFLVKG